MPASENATAFMSKSRPRGLARKVQQKRARSRSRTGRMRTTPTGNLKIAGKIRNSLGYYRHGSCLRTKYTVGMEKFLGVPAACSICHCEIMAGSNEA